VIASWREIVGQRRFVSYGPSRIFEAKRLAGYVQKVLNGEKPADLPIEQPVKSNLLSISNRQGPRAHGTASLLARADVIE